MGDFSLAEVLRSQLQGVGGNVSKLDTSASEEREQIEYIDIDKIAGDSNNFYELSGLEELAANIELLGLQQPLRVRTDPQASDHVVIVSGHRRKAALERLVCEGLTKFRQVPCIRERAEGSAALQELRLIYANSDTRTLTAAEMSRQAERVELLLYQLKEEGFSFPGRMRDHVAEACRISGPKLARLKVIRENLIPEYIRLFDQNHLPEQTAYALARLPEEFQKRLAAVLPVPPIGQIAEKVLKKYNEGWRWEPELTCPNGQKCKRGDTFLRRDCEINGWQAFCGGKTCCLECESAKASYSPCSRMCSKARARRHEIKSEADAKRIKEAQKAGRKHQQETQVYAKRLLKAIDAAGVPEDTAIPWDYRYYPVSDIRRWAAGEFDDPERWEYRARLVPGECRAEVEVARLLNCSADFLMGLTDELQSLDILEKPPTEFPVEETGGAAPSQDVFNLNTIPDSACRYVEKEDAESLSKRHIHWESQECKPPEGKLILTYQLTNDGPVYRPAVWTGTQFTSPNRKKILTGLVYTQWLEVPLPENVSKLDTNDESAHDTK